jgi:O-antigen/teichoic acid export membrane protein
MANKQIELGLLIISPIVILFLIFIDRIVIILYSSEFLQIKNVMIWSLLGMFFKLLSWSISYIFLAKGLSRKFIIYEVFTNLISVFANIYFYKYYQMEGLGFAFCLINLIYLLIVFYMAKYSFTFAFSIEVKKLFFVSMIISTLFAFILRFSSYFQSYVLYSALSSGALLIFYFSVRGLNQRLKIIKVLKSES